MDTFKLNHDHSFYERVGGASRHLILSRRQVVSPVYKGVSKQVAFATHARPTSVSTFVSDIRRISILHLVAVAFRWQLIR